MAWEYNNSEVTAYIELLETYKYTDNGILKTGIDNYKIIIEEAKGELIKRKVEKQLLLNIISNQLIRCSHIVEQLENDFSENNLELNYSIFRSNQKSAAETSVDMRSVSQRLSTMVGVDYNKLKRYKRQLRELTGKYQETVSFLSFYESFETLIIEVENKINSI